MNTIHHDINLRIPPEIFTIVVRYLSDAKDVLSMLSLTKEIMDYFVFQTPAETRNVEFFYPVMMPSAPVKKPVYPFCYNLTIGENNFDFKNLDLKEQYPNLTELKVKVPTYNPTSKSHFKCVCPEFIEFLKNRMCEPSQLRSLKLIATPREGQEIGSETRLGKELFAYLQQCNNLEVLRIKGFFIRPQGRRTSEPSLLDLPKMEKLILENCVCSGKLFKELSSLRHLELNKVCDFDTTNLLSLQKESISIVRLNDVIFREEFMEVFGFTKKEMEENWSERFSNITEFSIMNTDWEGQEKIPYQTMAKNLRKLAIGGNYYHDYTDDANDDRFYFALKKMKNLEELSLSVFQEDEMLWLNELKDSSLKLLEIVDCFNISEEAMKEFKGVEVNVSETEFL